ncbi:MAG: type II restriction endonuclease, partial [Candidatus Delongbacteria bacterium]|nr:type II restriction endonuclease [Candidatus Delongbacteria bacterium]
ISKYPSILKYLSNYKEQLTPKENKEDRIGRKPGQYKWYEIQDTVAYYEEFLKEKIIYAETMRIHKTDVMNFPRFGYDNNKYFCDKTTFIITGQNLKYLLGIMNSKLGAYLVKEYVTKLDTGGYMMQKVFIEEIPIIKPAENEKISQAVTKIIDLNKRNQTKEISEIEKEIDKLVYQLYGLTDEEIEIVERG